jgi:prepilin-type N-terminal cleavage/methylation domain-containing protein
MSASSTSAGGAAGVAAFNRGPVSATAGFTLIEVVLSLTIFALMGAVLYGAFALGHSAMAKSEISFTRSQQMRAVNDLLASYVRSAYPYRESPQDPSPYFYGESESLAFVSAYSHGLGGRGMAKISITADEDGAGRARLTLMESVPLTLGEGGAGAHAHSLTLQENIFDFRLAYLDPQSESEQWIERWDAKERGSLPRAVRFSYRIDNGEEVRWVFPVMMTVMTP